MGETKWEAGNFAQEEKFVHVRIFAVREFSRYTNFLAVREFSRMYEIRIVRKIAPALMASYTGFCISLEESLLYL